MINRIVKALESLLILNRATETLLIDIIASYSPWLAPVVPALMTYQNMTGNLGFPTWAALIGGAVVETLGLSSVQTAVTFWSWNDSKAKATPKAPVFLAILTGLFYLTTVLTVNALLDNAPAVSVLAKALLSSLSVCAGVILALRAGHSRRIREAELAKAERKQERAVLRAERRAGAVLSAAPLAQPGNNGRGHGIHQGESIR